MQSRGTVGEANCWWAQQVKRAEGAGRGKEKKECKLAPKCCARGWRNEGWVPQTKAGAHSPGGRPPGVQGWRKGLAEAGWVGGEPHLAGAGSPDG